MKNANELINTAVLKELGFKEKSTGWTLTTHWEKKVTCIHGNSYILKVNMLTTSFNLTIFTNLMYHKIAQANVRTVEQIRLLLKIYSIEL